MSEQLNICVRGLDDKKTPITTATIIHQAGNNVFVAGVAHGKDGESIGTEAVLRFDLDGEYLGTVWKKDYGEGVIQTSQSVRDITNNDEGDLILI